LATGQGALSSPNRSANQAAPVWLARYAPATGRQARPDLIEIKSGKGKAYDRGSKLHVHCIDDFAYPIFQNTITAFE
jgi:hypothetical protein